MASQSEDMPGDQPVQLSEIEPEQPEPETEQPEPTEEEPVAEETVETEDEPPAKKPKRVMTEKQLETLKMAREKALATRRAKAEEAKLKKDAESKAVEIQKLKLEEFAKSVQKELDEAKQKNAAPEEEPVKELKKPTKRTKTAKKKDLPDWEDFEDEAEAGTEEQDKPAPKKQRRIEPEKVTKEETEPSSYKYGSAAAADPAMQAYKQQMAHIKRNLVYRSVLPF